MKVMFAALALAALGLAQFARAGAQEPVPSQPADPATGTAAAYPDVWYWPDLHAHNRAIAFGSLILAASGSNVDSWKEVRPYGYCLSASTGGVVIKNPERPTSTDDGSGGTPGSGTGQAPVPVPVPGESSCGWSVMVTTAYQMVECPDGRAYIVRSGDGVALKGIHEGDVFGWAEGVACGPGPFFDASYAVDATRPLDVDRLTITMK